MTRGTQLVVACKYGGVWGGLRVVGGGINSSPLTSVNVTATPSARPGLLTQVFTNGTHIHLMYVTFLVVFVTCFYACSASTLLSFYPRVFTQLLYSTLLVLHPPPSSGAVRHPASLRHGELILLRPFPSSFGFDSNPHRWVREIMLRPPSCIRSTRSGKRPAAFVFAFCRNSRRTRKECKQASA